MKQTTLAALVAGVCLCAGGTNAWEQPPADCKPNLLNIPGAPYPCIFPDNRVMFRVAAPDAQNVRVRVGGGFDMSKGPDGLWYVDDHAASGGLSLLHTLCRRRHRRRSVDANVLRIRLLQQRDRSARTGGRRVLRAERRTARAGTSTAGTSRRSPANGDAATSIPRPTTTPIRKRSTRCCICCTGGARTNWAGTRRATSTSSWTT